MDAWGIDVAVTTSQKALEAPAGAGFVAISPNAIQHLKSSIGYNAFSLYSALEAHYKNEVMSTPTAQILIGVDASLTSIHQETLPIFVGIEYIRVQVVLELNYEIWVLPYPLLNPPMD
ncbi:MAG: hypothetical protein EBS07_10490 [Sphingobacteriia bacterium]|nr:hypothetical protein [Sphingobacteriia bacterium]